MSRALLLALVYGCAPPQGDESAVVAPVELPPPANEPEPLGVPGLEVPQTFADDEVWCWTIAAEIPDHPIELRAIGMDTGARHTALVLPDNFGGFDDMTYFDGALYGVNDATNSIWHVDLVTGAVTRVEGILAERGVTRWGDALAIPLSGSAGVQVFASAADLPDGPSVLVPWSSSSLFNKASIDGDWLYGVWFRSTPVRQVDPTSGAGTDIFLEDFEGMIYAMSVRDERIFVLDDHRTFGGNEHQTRIWEYDLDGTYRGRRRILGSDRSRVNGLWCDGPGSP